MIRPTQAQISRTALKSNIALLRSHLGRQTRVMGVVKADCYGHGVPLCVGPMIDSGIDFFGVATLNEANDLRTLGYDGRITLLTSPFENERNDIVKLDVEIFVSSQTTSDWLGETARANGRTVRAHVYVDTGMTRNGVWPEDAVDLANHITAHDGLELQGYASHFATSEEEDTSFATLQLERFNAGLASLRGAGYDPEDVHIANTGGILRLPGSHHTLVRPGIGLYGYHPDRLSQQESGLQPVMRLRTVLTSIRSVPAGTPVSYGRRFTTGRETRIGTLPIGYGDGLIRSMGGRFEVLIEGRVFPVVGTICMDEVMVDLGPEGEERVGDEVVVIGSSGAQKIDAWDVAGRIGSIPYEITTAIAPRVPRVAPQEGADGRRRQILSPFDNEERDGE